MEDLVSRQVVKELMLKYGFTAPDMTVTEFVEDLLSAQPEWIPCSEKYPDMDERVLVYTVEHEYHVWDCMSNRSDSHFWADEEGLSHHKYAVDEWMPLPESIWRRHERFNWS